MIGETILHYRVLDKLGEGGMGVVYRARDMRLERDVALKVLPPRVAEDAEERARFEREAKAAAALAHPNIATVFAIEESAGRVFIVLEFVEGEELRAILDRGPFTVTDALKAALQIAQGLDAAHQKGIVHRDIKSSNIMVSRGGTVKIMDFGLAKFRGGPLVTRAGTTVGTAAYMSPEQAQGEDVDHRSDLWSLGVVLYEMLTGELPFRGSHEAAMMYSVLHEEPPDLEGSVAGLSSDAARLIRRLLNKNPADRPQSAGAVASELRRMLGTSDSLLGTVTGDGRRRGTSLRGILKRPSVVAGLVVATLALIAGLLLLGRERGETLAERTMIAVLPLENLGGADREYFADGLTEEITNRLSGVSGLGVIARSSVMQYKNSTKPLRDIGNDLGVSYILQGTVRYSASRGDSMRVRVNPVLVRLSDGTQIWAESFDAVVADAFTLQSSIASRVVEALGVQLLGPERETLAPGTAPKAEAYDLYLRARRLATVSESRPDAEMADSLLQRAVALDPEFAPALALLSVVQSSMYWYFFDRTGTRVARARDYAEQALRINPRLAEAYTAMGFYHYHCKLDYENALVSFQKALALSPSDAFTLLGVAAVYRRQGRVEESLVTFQRAAVLDPRSAMLYFNLGNSYQLLRRYEEARRTYERCESLAPEWADPAVFRAATLLQEGRPVSEARKMLQEVAPRLQDTLFVRWAEVQFDLFDGRYQDAIARIMLLEEVSDQFRYAPRDLLLGRIYRVMKQADSAHACLERARGMLETVIRSSPDDARLHSALGIAYAGLGRSEDAVRMGRRAVEMLPLTREAWRGATRVYELALIYAIVGDADRAIDNLEVVLRMPSDYSGPWVRQEPEFAPLRGNPRFENLTLGKLR